MNLPSRVSRFAKRTKEKLESRERTAESVTTEVTIEYAEERSEPQDASDTLARAQNPTEPTVSISSISMSMLKRILQSFTPAERMVFGILAVVLIVSTLGLIESFNKMLLVELPASGGSLTEGVIGAPRFINPLLALSDTDRDLSELVYSGLLRATPKGELINDLASDYSISPDGLQYTFTLKDGLEWHDGKPITADDIVFTIGRVQDPALKSPRRASWEGVTVSKIDDKTVVFTLKQPYSPFLENTTMGILPKHIWDSIDSEQFGFSTYNISPVGSGPYKVSQLSKNTAGIPEFYDFVPYGKFSLGKPYINRVRVVFYANEDELIRGLRSGDIEAVNAISGQSARDIEKEGYHVVRYALPRVFGIFFNQSENPAFADKSVRQALSMALDRNAIIHNVLYGYATPALGPIPPGSIGYTPVDTSSVALTADQAGAAALLDKAGWKANADGIREKKSGKNTLQLVFSISTSDADELTRAAQLAKESWEKLGAKVTLKVYKTGELSQNIIRPRKYDALFFGEIIGRGSDPFAFWHSSQRTDPGLNIAGYSNPNADKLLEQSRVESDYSVRIAKYKQFDATVQNDIPSIFIYSPDFIYVVPNKIKNIQTGIVSVPSERFGNIYQWYIEKELVWSMFAPKKHT